MAHARSLKYVNQAGAPEATCATFATDQRHPEDPEPPGDRAAPKELFEQKLVIEDEREPKQDCCHRADGKRKEPRPPATCHSHPAQS
jgi:hypothetical protein